MSPDSTSGIVEQGSHSLPGSAWTLDVVRYQPTERPIEDRWSYAYDELSSRLVVGATGAPHAPTHISTTVPHSLIAHPASHHASMFAHIDAQLTKSFTDDHSLLRLRSKSKAWKSHALTAKSGCMALICDVDLKTMTATISNAGDCRLAVIRRRRGSDHSSGENATVIYETTDLNAKSPSEQARLAKEHPGEDMLIVSGRLFGRLMSTRGSSTPKKSQLLFLLPSLASSTHSHTLVPFL
ncbi:hypothetical protein NMY22_g16976 [Coprinellus aureogranulatus]|nr:hypothetical protein NMY22_g16976 [Coprinellus aureogranulatus]